MNWFKLKLCLIVVVLCCQQQLSAAAAAQEKTSEDETVPSEQTVDDATDDGNSTSPEELLGQSFLSNMGRNFGRNIGFQIGRTIGQSMDPFNRMFPSLAQSLFFWFSQAPFLGAPLDQKTAASSKVVLVLADDKTKKANQPQPDEDTLKRLTRNPQDFMQGMTGQLASLTDNMVQQVGQQAPGFSSLFRQAITDVVEGTQKMAMTNVAQQQPLADTTVGQQLGQQLGQSLIPPNTFDGLLGQFPQLSQSLLSQSPLADTTVGQQLGQQLGQSLIPPNTFDGLLGQFPQLAQSLVSQSPLSQSPVSQSSLAQSLSQVSQFLGQLPPTSLVSQSNPGQQVSQPSPTANPSDLVNIARNFMVGATQSSASTDNQPQPPADTQIKSAPAPDAVVSAPLIPSLTNPMFQFSSFPWNGFQLPLGSEISEVRVKPDEDSPYKLAPKEVLKHKMSEMKLKAILRDALTKKTLPILWFHLPTKSEIEPTNPDDVELATKLNAFEKKVIFELKQLQELSKLANELKMTQQNTEGKTTPDQAIKLNLHELPIYEITIADIEKTLKDEHVITLLHMIAQNQSKEFNKQHQTNSKYLTDLTGNPNKRQATEDTLKNLNKDDMMKMMSYAYRMAAINGHDMPWLKNDKTTDAAENKDSQQQHYSTDGKIEATGERQWLDDKQIQMNMDAEKQRQMAEERKHKGHHHNQNHHHHFGRQWADPNMSLQQHSTQRQMPSADMQQQQPIQRQMPNSNMQQPLQRQWAAPNMQQHLPGERKMTALDMQQQIADENLRYQQLQRQFVAGPNMQPQQHLAAQRQMPIQQLPFQRQMIDPTKHHQQMSGRQFPFEGMQQQQQQQQQPIQRQMPNPHMQQPLQRQWVNPNMQQHLPLQRQMAAGIDGQQQTQQFPVQRQWINPNMQKQMPVERQLTSADMQQQQQQQPIQRQLVTDSSDMQTQRETAQNHDQINEQRQWVDPNMPMKQGDVTGEHQSPNKDLENNPGQRQLADPKLSAPNDVKNPENVPEQRQWVDQNMQMQTHENNAADLANKQEQRQMVDSKMSEQSGSDMAQQRQFADPNMHMNEGDNSNAEQRQRADPEMSEQTAAKVQQKHMMEQRQWADPNMHVGPIPQAGGEGQMPIKPNNMPIVGEATPQMPENAGKARHKELEDMFDDLDLFGKGKHGKNKNKGTTINYYYNAGGSRYPPIYGSGGGYISPPPSYGGGYAMYPPRYGSYGGGSYVRPPPSYGYAHTSGYYGGGGYGSNAYGSRRGYRAASGDQEIAAMLREHQTMPKMMNENDDLATTATTTTEYFKYNAETKNQTKRLDNKLKGITYIIVVRPESRKLRNSKLRRKRSAEYTTLEPIDESSLNDLRKTYRNSLKEITLNPNETPEQALMRYNAESIREALEKANQQPMEISAGSEHEHEEEKQPTAGNQEEQQHSTQPYIEQNTAQYVTEKSGQYMTQQSTYTNNGQYTVPNRQIDSSQNHMNQVEQQQSSQPYIEQNSAQYVTEKSEQYMAQQPTYTNNGQYTVPNRQTQPIAITYNGVTAQNHMPTNNGVNNNFISKVNSPHVYTYPKPVVSQSPYLSVYNTLDSVPYIDDYSFNNQPYQYSSHNTINKNFKPLKSVVYHNVDNKPQPEITYNQQIPNFSNSINNKNQQYSPYTYVDHTSHTDNHKTSRYGNYITEFPDSKTQYVQRSNTPRGHTQMELPNQIKDLSHQKDSFENFISVVKERLSQCCNECKDTIFRGLDETIKQKVSHGNKIQEVVEINEKPHAVTQGQRQLIENNKVDNEFQQWRGEMSDKGYDSVYLTKEHQTEYLKNGKIHLQQTAQEDYRNEQDDILSKDYQSRKRETTMPETETEIVTAAIQTGNNIERGEVNVAEEKAQIYTDVKESQENEEEEEEEAEADAEEDKDKDNVEIIVKPQQNSNNDFKQTSKSLEPAESTTHSVYALRGKFKPSKRNINSYTLKYGKKFPTHNKLNKLGSSVSKKLLQEDTTSVTTKNSIENHKHLDEVLDLLYELSKLNKEKQNEKAKQETTTTSTTLKPTPSTSSASTTTTTTATKTTTSPTTTSKPLMANTSSSPTTTSNSLKTSTSSTNKPTKLKRRKSRKSLISHKTGIES